MPARDMAAYMRERRARQKAELKAEKEAIEQRGGRPVFTTHSSGEFGHRDGRKPRPAPPSSSRALMARGPSRPQPASMVAGIAGGRRVPAGYDAGTYPIPAPWRPEAMPSQLMHAIAKVEKRRREDRAEFEARISALETTGRQRSAMAVDWGDAACRFMILMNGLSEHGRAQSAARRGAVKPSSPIVT